MNGATTKVVFKVENKIEWKYRRFDRTAGSKVKYLVSERSLAGWQSSKGSIERRSRIRYVDWNVDWRYPACHAVDRAKHEAVIIVSIILPNLSQCHGR